MYDTVIDQQLTILKRNLAQWESKIQSIPEDLSPYGIPDLKRQDITRAFILIIRRLEELKNNKDSERNPFILQTLFQNFNNWTNPLETWIASSPGNIPNIYSHLNAMWSQLNTYAINYNQKNNAKELRKIQEETQKLKIEAEELLNLVKNLSAQKLELEEFIMNSEKLQSSSKNLLEESTKTKIEAETNLLVTLNLRENIEREQLEAQQLLNEIQAAHDKIPEFVSKQQETINQCDEVMNTVKNTFAAAARVGMARSFVDRAKEYNLPKKAWLATFIISLISIVGIAVFVIIPAVEDEQGLDRILHLVTEMPLTLPIIWLAWFSALRYNQLGRLSEDYAFKVATALSLEGYKQQAEEASPELKEKLLNLAITNFGENPLRLLNKESIKDTHPLMNSLDEKTLQNIIKTTAEALSKKI